MNLFSNPIILCGFIALSIVFILVVVVVICCKRSEAKEREELMAISSEIDSGVNEELNEQPDKIEDVLSKMQEVLEAKEESVSSFEEEQEENAIISYQELLDSLGTNRIDIDSIGVYEDELESQIEISDFNKEIIDAYQNEDLQKEFYKFQNDYSSSAIPIENSALQNTPIMNFDIDTKEEKHVDEEKVLNFSSDVVTGTKKFQRTKIISPVYGIVDNENKSSISYTSDDVEEIVFDDDSLLDEF